MFSCPCQWNAVRPGFNPISLNSLTIPCLSKICLNTVDYRRPPKTSGSPENWAHRSPRYAPAVIHLRARALARHACTYVHVAARLRGDLWADAKMALCNLCLFPGIQNALQIDRIPLGLGGWLLMLKREKKTKKSSLIIISSTGLTSVLDDIEHEYTNVSIF